MLDLRNVLAETSILSFNHFFRGSNLFLIEFMFIWPIKALKGLLFLNFKTFKHFGRDHWVTRIYSLSLKKREKVPSSKSQALTEERTCSVWGWIFGWSHEGFISSARKESTDADIVRKFFFSLYVSDLFQLFCFEFLPGEVALLGK